MALAVKYKLSDDFPSYYSHRYLHDDKLGKNDLRKLDEENRRNLRQYLANIETMEELTRVQTNLALLRKHQAELVAAGKRTVEVNITAAQIGPMALVTFPGELTVQIGLNIQKSSPLSNTCVAGYSNGYIYYAPTAEQLQNPGSAQEDCDSILAAPWQQLFEARAAEMLESLRK